MISYSNSTGTVLLVLQAYSSAAVQSSSRRLFFVFHFSRLFEVVFSGEICCHRKQKRKTLLARIKNKRFMILLWRRQCCSLKKYPPETRAMKQHTHAPLLEQGGGNGTAAVCLIRCHFHISQDTYIQQSYRCSGMCWLSSAAISPSRVDAFTASRNSLSLSLAVIFPFVLYTQDSSHRQCLAKEQLLLFS